MNKTIARHFMVHDPFLLTRSLVIGLITLITLNNMRI